MKKQERAEELFEELSSLRKQEKEIESQIEQIKEVYVFTWDDDEATALRVEWRKLREELHAIEARIDEIWATRMWGLF